MTSVASIVDYILRNEQDADEPFLLELYRSLHQEADFAGCSFEQQREIVAFERNIQNQTIEAVFPTAKASILVVDGEPAGEIIVDRTPSSMRLIEIAIVPWLQQQGIGGDLVRHLCKEAADRHVPLDLRVAVGNVRARRFYARLGFIETDADNLYIDLTWKQRTSA